MKQKYATLLVVLPIITVCLAALYLISCPSKNCGNAELRQFFAESSIIANIVEARQSYDRDQPLGIYSVADMTIVTLPIKPLLRGSTTCIWIDNATKQAVFCFEY